MRKLIILVVLCSLAFSSLAKPVKSIDIYTMPYYSAQNGKAEMVNVYSAIDSLLLKNNLDGYQQAVKIVKENASIVTPMTLLTLAARAYDLGLRDEAVFWFYVGRKRLLIVDHVAALPKMQIAEYGALVTLTKPAILGYAFCDMKKQEKILENAHQWTKDNPYQALLNPRIPSKFQDRLEGLKDAQKMLDKDLQEQKELFGDPKTKEKIKQTRKKNNIDEQYCW